MTMLDTITSLMKQGKLKDAADKLHEFALGAELDSETLSDIVVLSGNISELAKQEKRRKISAQEALDIKTRYAFELEDIVSVLRESNPPAISLAPVRDSARPHAATPHAATPGSNNNSNVNNINISVNVSIENIITTEIKQNIHELDQGFHELKNQLNHLPEDAESIAIEKELEELESDLKVLNKADKKDELPESLKRVEKFIKKLEQGNDYASKAFQLGKKGVDTLQKIGKNYNAIAQWVGMPQIPSFFL